MSREPVQIMAMVSLSPEQLAEAFCALDDEAQATFFIEAARLAHAWLNGPGSQWHLVGRHLQTCPCSTEAAREMVREIAEALR